MQKNLRIGLLSLATVVTFVGAATTPSSSPGRVTADVSDNSFKTDVAANKPVAYTESFKLADVDKVFLFPYFLVSDYQSPYFHNIAGTPTKSLLITADFASGSTYVWNNMTVQVTVNQGGAKPKVVYTGPIRKLVNLNVLQASNYSIKEGMSQTLKMEVWVPKAKRAGDLSRSASWIFYVAAK